MPTSSDRPLLEVEGLYSGYGPLLTVRNISLMLYPGEAVAILGPNGVGKTTLLMAVAGALPPRRGRVRVAGRDVTGQPVESVAAHGLSLVPDRRALFPSMTVEDNLRLGLWAAYRRGVQADTEWVLELFPVLAEKRYALAGALSGGQQQMLAIARALVARPIVLLLDEPSTGLAPRMVPLIFEGLKTLVDGGLAVLVAEQNVSSVMTLCQRAIVLRGGEVIAELTRDDLVGKESSLNELFL